MALAAGRTNRKMPHVVVMAAIGFVMGVAASPASGDIDAWLNSEVNQALQALADEAKPAVNSRLNSKRPAAPVKSGNSTTLVDTSSVSDLVGVALNLAGLSGFSGADVAQPSSVSGTVSGYAFYTAVRRIDPLSPEHYCEGAADLLRGISATVGYDDDDELSDRAIIAGGKWSFSQESVCDTKAFEGVQNAIGAWLTDYDRIETEFSDWLFAQTANGRSREAFDDDMGSPEELSASLEAVGLEEARAKVAELVRAQRPEGFERLGSEIRSAIQAFENRQRYSVQFLTTQRETGDNDYEVKLIAECGSMCRLPDWLKLTLNGSYEHQQRKVLSNSNGGAVSLALDFRGRPKSLSGRRPIRATLAGEGKWLTDAQSLYKGNLNVSIPILDGVELPLSVTVANRTELIDETDVRGNVGFSFDTARMIELFR